LPRTINSPARQSMSSNRKPATSPRRIPNRTSIVKIAKSRTPATVDRSQLSNRRRTCPESSARGNP